MLGVAGGRCCGAELSLSVIGSLGLWCVAGLSSCAGVDSHMSTRISSAAGCASFVSVWIRLGRWLNFGACSQ